MPTSKANTNTITKIELDAIPPSLSSGALLYFPKKAAAYNPAEIDAKLPRLSRIEIDPLIPEDHESCDDGDIKKDSDDEKKAFTLKQPILQVMQP